MSSNPIGPIRRAWYRWKALKLPWRKRFLVGLDLNGNTFWEFYDTLGNQNSTRMRRIIQFRGRGADRGAGQTRLSDVTSQISPAWHQWLRHTRQSPPSLVEQSQDLVRQEQLKVLAAQADARWEAKARVGDAPGLRKSLPAMQTGSYTAIDVKDERATRGVRRRRQDAEVDSPPVPPASPTVLERDKSHGEPNMQVTHGKENLFVHPSASQTETGRGASESRQHQDDPWKKARSGLIEEWQPQQWNPNSAAARK